MSLAAAVAVFFTTATLSNLHADGKYFKDEQGAVVVLRGVNVAGNAKVPPFTALRDTALLDPLPGWGLNVIRLLFTWEAFEPRPGEYNEAYLHDLENIVRAAWQRGIYTVLDFHQDGLARTLLHGCGEGFPSWAITASVKQVLPDNSAACHAWAVRMLFDRNIEAAWHGFYRDDEGAKNHFVAMAGHVAQRLSHVEGLLGYDFLNEPLGHEPTELGDFYEEVADAIRTQDTDAILFLNPHASVSAGLQSALPKPSFTNVVYAPHFYDSMVVTFKIWLGQLLLPPFKKMASKAEQWNAPLFVGEFGAPARTWRVNAYMDMMFRHLDADFVSGAQWGYTPGWNADAKDGWNGEDFSIVDDTGATRPNFKPRAYAQRIAGTPLQITVRDNALSHYVDLLWNHTPAQGATTLFVPDAMFGDRSVSLATSGEALRCTHAEQRVTCTSPSPGIKHLRLE